MEALTGDEAFRLQWLAAAYPRGFRDVVTSVVWASLIRKELVVKLSTGRARQLKRTGERYPYAVLNLVDYFLTAKGLRALAHVNQELWVRVSDRMASRIAARKA